MWTMIFYQADSNAGSLEFLDLITLTKIYTHPKVKPTPIAIIATKASQKTRFSKISKNIMIGPAPLEKKVKELKNFIK